MNKNNKEILNYCPNFRKIVEFEYLENDYISEKLIKFYTDYIFNVDINNKEDLKHAKQIDTVLERYINDYNFRKELKKSLQTLKVKNDDNMFIVLKSIIESILKLFDLYVEQTMTKKNIRN